MSYNYKVSIERGGNTIEKKVSVIIPVYNAEKHITRCVESLLNQTLKECEFIFINDGSTDSSRKIIERYSQLDNRIKLINKENEGVSIARNIGLHYSIGKYIGFVDADDYVEADMYRILYEAAVKDDCDTVISNFEIEIDGEKIITRYPFPVDVILQREYIEEELLPYYVRYENLNTACNKIYRRKLINEKKIRFPEKIELGEDALFNINFFAEIASTKYLDYIGYHYVEVKGSATRNIANKDYFGRALEVYKQELPKVYVDRIGQAKVKILKSQKLVDSLISYIHIYLRPCKSFNFRNRYKYVKNMVCNKKVKEALPIYRSEKYETLGRYEKFIIEMIERESIFGLYCATAYSRFRNENYRRDLK